MKISTETLEQLALIISGDSKISPYRSGPLLIDFFNGFGENDKYDHNFGSRLPFTCHKLDQFNGTDALKKIIYAAFDFWNLEEYVPTDAAKKFNRFLERDGYLLSLKFKHQSVYAHGQLVPRAPYYVVIQLQPNVLVDGVLTSIKFEEVVKDVYKAQSRLEMKDYDGAISTSRTMVESLLKRVLKETKTEFKENMGDLTRLYSKVRRVINLNPASDTINERLKPILDGLMKIIAGTEIFANTSSDRHTRKYKASAHHAFLAVNSSYVISRLIVESYEHQKERKLLSESSNGARTGQEI